MDVKYLPQMADEDNKRRYLFVAIDRATRWVYAEIFAEKTALAARRFLHHLHKACPVHISTILTDNGMVERFNGRISEVLAMHRFDSRASLEQTLKRYVLCTINIYRKRRWGASRPSMR